MKNTIEPLYNSFMDFARQKNRPLGWPFINGFF